MCLERKRSPRNSVELNDKFSSNFSSKPIQIDKGGKSHRALSSSNNTFDLKPDAFPLHNIRYSSKDLFMEFLDWLVMAGDFVILSNYCHIHCLSHVIMKLLRLRSGSEDLFDLICIGIRTHDCWWVQFGFCYQMLYSKWTDEEFFSRFATIYTTSRQEVAHPSDLRWDAWSCQ